MAKEISSVHNSLVKELLHIKEKSRTRRNRKLFVIEGIREFRMGLSGNYSMNQVLFDPNKIAETELTNILLEADQSPELIAVTSQVYEKLAHRGSTEGLIAVANTKEHNLNMLHFKTDTPLILVAEAPEKPGNIGALLRTADAVQADAVIIANPLTDLYNPNIVRTSIGCVFTVPIATGGTEDILQFLKDSNINIYGAALSAAVPYDTVNYTEACAIVVGTESTGLTDTWLEKTTKNIMIPMQGEIDSLNVSVSAAVLLFEAIRQRKNN